jgi:radical SAM superfamily enzyme YgiQ (UPF0313 family)
MLTLVEPCAMTHFLDRPDLGCSMLIAACQERGIKTTLIKGQTRYLKDMFVNDSQELWDLMRDLDRQNAKKLGIDKYRKNIQQNGFKKFQIELRKLYEYFIIDKSPRHYLDAQTLEIFIEHFHVFVLTSVCYLTKLNYTKLKIVDRYVSEIIKSNPRYIGFSLHYPFEPFSLAVRKRIKELTGLPIIAGGTMTPFLNLKTLEKTFKEGYFDYLVIGAGEHALPCLIDAIENKKEPSGIANVFYWKNGKIKGNDLKIINDLDKLPYPDYSQFDLDLYLTPKRILPLQTTRGCNWRRCAFCAHHRIYLGQSRMMSVEKIIEVIKHLQESYNCSHFSFHDDELPAIRAKKISEALLSSKLKNISIYSYARTTDGYNNSKLLRSLRKAGFSTFAWGLESGSQRVLDSMDKGINIATAHQVLKKSSQNEITNLCFILFGFPGETRKEAQETVEFLKRNADYIDDILISRFHFNSFSPLGINPRKWGVLDINKNGGFLTSAGMSQIEAKSFISHFEQKRRLNNIKTTSEKLKYFTSSFNSRMLHFLNSSNKLVSNKIIMSSLMHGNLPGIFPIILGKLRKRNGKTIFYPINIMETSFVNRHYAEKERVLSNLEEKIFILSEGILSLEGIISSINNDFNGGPKERYIRKKCLDFFQEIFSRNWALGYSKSWSSP